jgi:L(+)-tartrate dehydratase alpha subunit
VARLYPDGRVAYRTDPDWFTPYQRRETVDWLGGAQEAAE